MTATQTLSFARTEELSVLDAALANTDYRPTLRPQGAPVALADLGLALPAPVVVRPTTEQRAEIAALRAKLGASPLAAQKCEPTRDAAEAYLVRLRSALAPTLTPVVAKAAPERRTAGAVVGRLAVTPKQWSYVRHLRGQLRKGGEGWLNDLAKRDIPNDRRAASRYIDEMRAALKSRWTRNRPAGRTGGVICSVCWTDGCTVGPMVPR